MAKITQEDLDVANASDDPIATLAARKEGGAKTRSIAAAPATKPKVVTKEELAASGLSLRDYLNKQQGLTRRDGSAVETTAPKGAGAGRGGRGGPSADELDAYAKGASQRAKDKAQADADKGLSPMERLDRQTGERSGRTNNVEGGNPTDSQDYIDVQNTLNALGGLGNTLRAGVGAARAAKGAASGSRALAEKGLDEVTYLGKTAPKNITPAERLTTSAKRIGNDPKRIASDDTARIPNNPTKRLAAPEEEVASRDAVMRRKNWEEGPSGELGDKARDRIFDRDFWTRGPSADMKTGGKVKGYAKGGTVKGWGKARGARGAKIV